VTAEGQAPTVSVLLPAYNHAAFVGEAVESVLSQSFGDFELIVTDDGSTDGTAEVLRRYRDPRIKLEVLGRNEGAAPASNRCVERARGEFVAMANSDDFFLPGKLERQVQLLRRRPEVAAVFGQVRFVDEAGQTMPAASNPFADLFTTVEPDRFAWLRTFFLRGNGLCQPTIMARRDVYRQIGAYDPSLRQLHDFDLWVRMCARHEIHVLPDALIGYRVLAQGQNASAPNAAVIRRTVWEHTRVRERYRHMDPETLRRAFGADIPAAITARDLPMPVQLALMAAGLDSPQFHLFALETLQDAVQRQVPGVTAADLHEVSGRVDPLRLLEYDAQRMALLEVTRQRDEARLQVDGLAGYLRASIAALQVRDAGVVVEEMSQAMAAFRPSGS